MTEFLAALMTLISTFIQPAKPDVVAPVAPVNLQSFNNRGQQVQELAQSLNPHHNGVSGPTGVTGQGYPFDEGDNGLPIGNSSFRRHWPEQFGPTGPTGSTGEVGSTGQASPTGPTGTTGLRIFRISAENISSEITIPHELPEVAVEHSSAINGASSGFPLPPGFNR